MRDKQAWLCAQPFICCLGWRCLCLYLISKGHRRCCWAQHPSPPEASQPVQLGGAQETTVCLKLCCARVTARVTAMCLSLPSCSQLARQRVIQELCCVLAYALQNSKRAEIREIISSSSRAILTHSYLPFLKKKLLQNPHHLHSTEFGFSFLIWSWASSCTSTFLSQQAQLYHSDSQRRTHVWERLLERAVGSSCSGLSLGTMEPSCHTLSGNRCISAAPAVLSSAVPKIQLTKKEMGRGEKESEKRLCSQGGKKMNSSI